MLDLHPSHRVWHRSSGLVPAQSLGRALETLTEVSKQSPRPNLYPSTIPRRAWKDLGGRTIGIDAPTPPCCKQREELA